MTKRLDEAVDKAARLARSDAKGAQGNYVVTMRHPVHGREEVDVGAQYSAKEAENAALRRFEARCKARGESDYGWNIANTKRSDSRLDACVDAAERLARGDADKPAFTKENESYRKQRESDIHHWVDIANGQQRVADHHRKLAADTKNYAASSRRDFMKIAEEAEKRVAEAKQKIAKLT